MQVIFEKRRSGTMIKNGRNDWVGEIFPIYRGRSSPPCPTCGHEKVKQVVSSYGLSIRGRYWNGAGTKLRPKNHGGGACAYRKRLIDIKALAMEVLS